MMTTEISNAVRAAARDAVQLYFKPLIFRVSEAKHDEDSTFVGYPAPARSIRGPLWAMVALCITLVSGALVCVQMYTRLSAPATTGLPQPRITAAVGAPTLSIPSAAIATPNGNVSHVRLLFVLDDAARAANIRITVGD